MAQRRFTRSSSKTQDLQQIQSTSAAHAALVTRNKKKIKSEQTESEMDYLLDGDQQLEAALNPAADFLPECFLSQPRPTLSSQLSDAGLAFDSDLLKACDTAPTNDDWKYRDDGESPPGTQLDMVDGFHRILDYPSVLYSPESPPAPVTSPAAPPTTGDELLQFYLGPDPVSSAPSLSPYSGDFDDDTANIPDEDLLNDLDSILSSYEEPEADASLAKIRIEFNPPADTVALALSSQYEEGINVIVDDSQSSADDDSNDAPLPDVAPVAGPSRRGKSVATKTSQPASKRGRKRKVSSDSDSADSRKKKQNAEAAKNYRKRKADQMIRVFEEKEVVEKELEKARKKLQVKLNERNILLKMLYESYKQNDSANFKILFPNWIDDWYQQQKDD